MATHRRWRALTIGVIGGLALATAAPSAANAAPASAASTINAHKVDAAVTRDAADGKATFWIVLGKQASLSSAAGKATKQAKGTEVYRIKTALASTSQAPLKAILDAAQADYQPFWISNRIRVTGPAKLLDTLAARPDVARIEADKSVAAPKPAARKQPHLAATSGVEWNIDAIGAPHVWSQYGDRGEGITVASVDSGVDFTHPALAAAYRGRHADGTVDNNYNWFDPSHTCPAAEPCDNNDHGTHTMGTMAGDDGTHQIGVAPGARWISAKGCETSSCTESSLLAAGQWIVAPTDLNNQNPRPDLAPDVVNNSWGSDDTDTWYSEIVASWVAAGIFPSFSNGNNGDACDTTGSPGGYVQSYSSGAFDRTGTIASFSSRGLGQDGEIKPNITAPGVDVYSSIPGGFDSFNGTSMAAPHTSGTVALMWSAAPALRGHVDETRAILDKTAVDVPDEDCPGGTPGDNLTYGEGRLDAFAAVTASPRGPSGTLRGTVTSGGQPLAGVTVTAGGTVQRTASTGADGSYDFPVLAAGDYTVSAAKYGYRTASTTAAVTEGGTVTADLDLAVAPTGTLTGTVTTADGPVAGSVVSLAGTPASTTTGADGHYSLTAPEGHYTLTASSPDRCADPASQPVDLAGNTVLDVVLPGHTDAFGYSCASTDVPYPALTSKLDLAGDDFTTSVALPFPVPLYGQSYARADVSTNGNIAFGQSSTTGANTPLPSTLNPNAALYPFWDDLRVDADAGVYTGVVGTAPHRYFAVEWRNVQFYADATARVSFVALAGEDGSVVYRYKDVTGAGIEAGSGATIGVEDATGTGAYQYSYNSAAIADGTAIRFRATKSGVVRGRITDGNDGLGVGGATVTVGSVAVTTTAEGYYVAQIPPGSVPVTVSAPGYESASGSVTVAALGVSPFDAVLRTANVTVTPSELEVVVPPGQTRTRTLALKNTGALGTPYAVTETPDLGWLSVSGGSGSLASGSTATATVTVSAAGMSPGTFQTGSLTVTSQSGRALTRTITVRIVVPAFQSAIDSGATTGHTDLLGDGWTPDRAYQTGSCGYLGTSGVLSTSKAIAKATDQARYATARQNMYEYRCDGLPSGTYTLELNFAELKAAKPNTRVFDVLAEGTQVLPSLDLALEAGSFTAVDRTYLVKVTDGQFNVRFITHTGFGKPLVNAIRITQRPDKTAP
ncbi:MAG: hypothetical protein QOD41_1911 [Cryptosporangiaceae bacterium]|nr:hypothetical protein [Cryptosporangiaceae bacterium]